MHAQGTLLIDSFEGDDTHLRTGDGFADGGRISGIILTVFATHAIRGDELRGDQFRGVPQSCELARPVVRTRAGLHRNNAWAQRGDQLQQTVTTHRALQSHFAIFRRRRAQRKRSLQGRYQL